VIGNRAGVSVVAGTGIKDRIDAAILARTEIVRAIITVLAKFDVSSFNKGWFVSLTIAVIVATIARFCCRSICITRR